MKIDVDQVEMIHQKNDFLEEEVFDSLLEKDKKQVVRILAKKVAESPDIKDIWINNQIEGVQPMIEWDDDKLKAVARDYFDWK